MPEGRRALLATARSALQMAKAPLRPWPPGFKLSSLIAEEGERRAPAPWEIIRRAAFVTLRIGSELRGCIGHITADRQLGDLVFNLAIAAGSEDPRFPSVRPEELEHITVEISVLTTPQAVDPRDLRGIVIGRDGLIVERGTARGLLLPQVAPEHGWGPGQFLEATCEKAGLPKGAWREPGTRVLTFQADVFEEESRE